MRYTHIGLDQQAVAIKNLPWERTATEVENEDEASGAQLEAHIDLNVDGRRLNETPLSVLRDANGRNYNSPDQAIRLLMTSTNSE